MTPSEARARLLTLDTASPADIAKAYRTAAMKTHQALGVAQAGEELRLLAEARRVATEAARRMPCPECEGRGIKLLQRGFTATEIPCLPCGGTGRMYP